MTTKFKYREELDSVNSLGICCPPTGLTPPPKIPIFRFVFEEDDLRNHKPPGINNPKRILKENDSKKCSLYALSCFKNPDGAKDFYSYLIQNIPNIYKSIGSCLCGGELEENDGLMSEEGKNTHFDLFEFEECNLAEKFTVIEKLI